MSSAAQISRRMLLAAVGLPVLAGAQTAPLRLGLAPYLSPAALMAAFRPLREQLERSLAQPVELYTARDFRALTDAVQRSEYDIALLPAHLARVAVADWHWAPLARTVAATPVLVLVRGNGVVRSPADLRGGRVGMLDMLSLVAAVGARWLADQRLAGPDGAQIVAMPSINSALIALERDELSAVVAAASQLQGLTAPTPTEHRTLARLENIPGPMFVARPGVAAETVARWRQALLAVTPDTSRPLTAANVQPTALSSADLEAIEAYAAFLRRQLASGR